MLMIPGPSDPEPAVLAEISRPILPHYGPKWSAVYNETKSMMQKILKTKNEIIIVPIPGQLAVEMAAHNLVEKGQEAFVCDNGIFAASIEEAISAVGGKATPINSELGRGPTLEEVRAVVEGSGRDPAGKTLFLVQNETSTGAATNPAEIFAYCKSKGIYTVLDSISAVGGMDIRADEWHADYTVGYASKALGGVNGAQPVAIAPDIWKLAAKRHGRVGSVFLDLKTWRDAIDHGESWGHPHPTSMPTSVIVGLHKAASLALEEGLERRYKRHADAAKQMRDGLKSLGLELFTDPNFFSNTVSVARVDANWDGEFRDRLLSEYDLMIAGGLDRLRGKIIRVGHMGSGARPERVATALAVFDRVLREVRH
jgi:alanine-glyoxylate transaminase/serine-glyoxylate transaminase/serine-pyruvate transaminase